MNRPDVVIPPDVFAGAVSQFWLTRGSQATAQAGRGAGDRGERAAVTGGRQMDGFLDTITEHLLAVGVEASNIHRRARVDVALPGFYRATKEWDLLVVVDGVLAAVVEIKSQVGPSFGNNMNNRTEEAVGSAEDLWTAYREGAFGSSPAPWLGYLFLLEDCPESRRPVRELTPHYPVLPEFKGASYMRRYELLCRKLVLERKYSAACFLMSPRPTSTDGVMFVEPAEDLSAERFLRGIMAHMAAV